MFARGFSRLALNLQLVNFGTKAFKPKKIRLFELLNISIVRKILIPGSLAFVTFAQATVKSKSQVMADDLTLENILQNADQLYDENHYQEVYDLLEKYQNQSLPEIKWRKARALYCQSKTQKNKEEKQKLIRDSYVLIKDALAANENDFAIHKWMAIVLDANAELDGIKSRVTQLETVRNHMQRAIDLNPSDPTSWYLIGQFEFSLADMPWIQRKIVSTVFASPPSGTYEKALEYFEKAEGIKEGFYTMNWLMLGKCYLLLKETDKAKVFLEKAANCRTLNEDDSNCKEEATKLLKKL